ncbi:hypothetical protein [Streptomyces abikoensis]
MNTATTTTLDDSATILLAAAYGLTMEQAHEAMAIMTRNALNSWYGAAARDEVDPHDLDAMDDHFAATMGPRAFRDAEELAAGTVLRAAAEPETPASRRAARVMKTNRPRVRL